MNDALRAALIAFINSLFPVLILAGVINWSDTQIATIMLAVNNGLTLLAFIFKKGQESSG